MKELKRPAGARFWVWYLLILLCAAAMYALLSLEGRIWADECYSMAMIRHSFADIWKITTADVHPPLYYFFMKLAAAPFGYSLHVVRFASSIPCLLIMAIGGVQLRKLFAEKFALLFMGLFLLFPFLMRYATECRMYSLSELFLFLNCIWAYRCWKWNKKKDWALFAVFGGLCCYCHYFAAISAAMVYLMLFGFLVAKKRELLKPWLLASVGTVVIFLPWMPSFLYQLFGKTDNAYWIDPISLNVLFRFAVDLFYAGKLVLFPVFMGLGYLIALIVVLRSRNREDITIALLALAVPVLTIGAGVVISIVYRPMFVMRYAAQAIPMMVLFFAYVLSRMENKALMASLLTVAIMGGVSHFTDDLQDVFTLDPDRFSTEMVESFPACDAYVVLSGNPNHVSQELSFFDRETPIYTTSPDLFGPDNPYPNRNPYDTFSPEQTNTLLLLVSQGEDLEAPFTQDFKAELLGSVSVSGSWHDMWYLQRIAP